MHPALPPSSPSSRAQPQPQPTKPPAPSHSNSATRRQGRRDQQDLSHLLGFSFGPRAQPAGPNLHLPRRSAKRQLNYGVHDKERFVHQAYRFIVKPDKDYTKHFADPDVRLDWSDVIQVIVDTTTALSSASTLMDQPTQPHGHGIQAKVPTCPICLSDPTAARMTKCGHIFCFPCMLHYLALAEPGMRWRRCPVCWENVYPNDLRSVLFHDPIASVAAANLTPYTGPPATATATGAPPTASSSSSSSEPRLATEPLKMRLVRRPPISTLALPRSPNWPSDAVPALRAPWQFTPDALTFARIVLADPETVKRDLNAELATLKREEADLRRWGAKGGTDEELGVLFNVDAQKRVEEQVARVDEIKQNQGVMNARKRALRELAAVEERVGRALSGGPLPVAETTSASEVEEEDGVPRELLASMGAVSLGAGRLSSTAPAFVPGGPPSSVAGPSSNKGRPPRRNVNPPPEVEGDGSYLFYQAASGQNIFLQPLDIKVLKAHFGQYSQMPDTIEVLVEGTDEGSMNDEMRKRCKWLAHLPTNSDVVFVEVDLSRVVSRAALEPFAHALKQRRTKRRDKARKDDKAKLKSEQREQDALPVFALRESYEASAFDLPLGVAFPLAREGGEGAGQGEGGMSTSASPPGRPTVWGTQAAGGSFAGALHGSSRGGAGGGYHEEDFDDRWDEWEDHLRGGGGGVGGRRSYAGASAGSNSGGGAAATAAAGAAEQAPGAAGTGRRSKKKKLVLNLTTSGRGA